MPVIVIELFLVLGAVLAFAIWQFRDLAQERRRREQREQREVRGPQASPRNGAAGGARRDSSAGEDDHAR